MSIHQRADIAIGPISVMSERENVVDFTVPFHEPVGLTILMKKQKFEYILHKFLKVRKMSPRNTLLCSFIVLVLLDKGLNVVYIYKIEFHLCARGVNSVVSFKTIDEQLQ